MSKEQDPVIQCEEAINTIGVACREAMHNYTSDVHHRPAAMHLHSASHASMRQYIIQLKNVSRGSIICSFQKYTNFACITQNLVIFCA